MPEAAGCQRMGTAEDMDGRTDAKQRDAGGCSARHQKVIGNARGATGGMPEDGRRCWRTGGASGRRGAVCGCSSCSSQLSNIKAKGGRVSENGPMGSARLVGPLWVPGGQPGLSANYCWVMPAARPGPDFNGFWAWVEPTRAGYRVPDGGCPSLRSNCRSHQPNSHMAPICLTLLSFRILMSWWRRQPTSAHTYLCL